MLCKRGMLPFYNIFVNFNVINDRKRIEFLVTKSEYNHTITVIIRTIKIVFGDIWCIVSFNFTLISIFTQLFVLLPSDGRILLCDREIKLIEFWGLLRRLSIVLCKRGMSPFYNFCKFFSIKTLFRDLKVSQRQVR